MRLQINKRNQQKRGTKNEEEEKEAKNEKEEPSVSHQGVAHLQIGNEKRGSNRSRRRPSIQTGIN